MILFNFNWVFAKQKGVPQNTGFFHWFHLYFLGVLFDLCFDYVSQSSSFSHLPYSERRTPVLKENALQESEYFIFNNFWVLNHLKAINFLELVVMHFFVTKKM